MLVANLFGTDGIIVVVIALIVVFGGSQLPKIARNIGSAGKEFKKGQQDDDDHKTSTPPPVPQAITPPVVAPAPVPASPDTVTVSKADLEALIDERLGSKSDPAAN